MPVNAYVGKKKYEGTDRNHAEEVLFASGKYNAGNLTVDLDAWPCTGERGHNCHRLFQTRSAGRTITVNVSGDHAGYAVNHGLQFGATGTITYADGAVTYT
jgi:Cu2+-containing amine oxidase